MCHYLDTRGTAGNAGTGRIRTGKKDEKSAGKGKKARRGIQRNVHISDHEYLFAAVDPDQCDRLPESVWKYESGGNCRCGDCGDNGEYAGRDGVL